MKLIQYLRLTKIAIIIVASGVFEQTALGAGSTGYVYQNSGTSSDLNDVFFIDTMNG